MGEIEDRAETGFAALYDIFSKPISNAQRYRRYNLAFRNGEPVFELSEVDRGFEGIIGRDPEEG
jgi:hypothetical protein